MASRVELVVGGIGLVDNGVVTDVVSVVLLLTVGWHNRQAGQVPSPA